MRMRQKYGSNFPQSRRYKDETLREPVCQDGQALILARAWGLGMTLPSRASRRRREKKCVAKKAGATKSVENLEQRVFDLSLTVMQLMTSTCESVRLSNDPIRMAQQLDRGQDYYGRVLTQSTCHSKTI